MNQSPYQGPDVTHILPFGPSLITVDGAGDLRVWDIKTASLLKKVRFEPESFEVTALGHPLTYKDKVLLGSRQGALKLYNLKTEKQIYRFSGWDGSAVTCLTPCPSALDAVAVGLASGTIVVHNIKFDEEFVRFKQVKRTKKSKVELLPIPSFHFVVSRLSGHQ